MKIYIAKEHREFLPVKSKIPYPPNNTNKNFGVEQDFYQHIKRSEHLTADYDEADWVYLPIFWQRHCFNNNYYMGETGLGDIQQYLKDTCWDKKKKYFLVSAMDNGPLGTPHRRQVIDGAIYFNGCVGDQEIALKNIHHIPLLTSEWKLKPDGRAKRYLASFVGRKATHPVRAELFARFENRKDFLLVDGYVPNYAEVIADSLVSLCPRGNGLSSFRFFESMQIGVVPVLIAERDVRPFRNWIPWEEISFHVSTLDDLESILSVKQDRLIEMGQKARDIYYRYINFGKWHQFVFRILANH